MIFVYGLMQFAVWSSLLCVIISATLNISSIFVGHWMAAKGKNTDGVEEFFQNTLKATTISSIVFAFVIAGNIYLF